MTKIPELQLGARASMVDLRVGLEETAKRLNRVIRAVNELDGSAGGGGGGVGTPGPQGEPGPQGPPGPPGTGLSRTTVSIVTASLAAGATENGTVAVARGAELYTITADRACRVIFYSTAAARTADSGRALGVPAPPGEGISGEFSFAGPGTFYVDPTPVLKNLDSTTSDIYYAITNNSGGASVVTVTILFLPLET